MEQQMAKTETIRARISPELKHRAEGIFSTLGLNASQAITLFYRQVDLHQGLPFPLAIPPQSPHWPNAETRAAIEKAERGENLTVCKDADDFFRQLGI